MTFYKRPSLRQRERNREIEAEKAFEKMKLINSGERKGMKIIPVIHWLKLEWLSLTERK